MLGADDARAILLRQHGLELLPLAGREAVRESVGVRDVHGDVLRLSLFDELTQEIPLRLAHQLGSPADRGVDGLARVICLVQPALRRAAEGQPVHAPFGTPIVEHVNRAATREERRRRDELPEGRVLVVVAHRDHPHRHAVLAHQPREHRVEVVAQPFLLQGLPARAACRGDAPA